MSDISCVLVDTLIAIYCNVSLHVFLGNYRDKVNRTQAMEVYLQLGKGISDAAMSALIIGK